MWRQLSRSKRISFLTAFLVVVVGVLMVSNVANSPLFCVNNDKDDCYETEMHPNLPHLETEINFDPDERNTSYWIDKGMEYALNKSKFIANQDKKKHAKNVIFFIGEGMSLTTLAATRIYLGSASERLSFEKFPYTGLARTHSMDHLVPDRAAAATALLCGVKARNGVIGLDGSVKRGSCIVYKGTSKEVPSIAKKALDGGKWVGFVTNARVTSTTTAALYANINDKGWKTDVHLVHACPLHAHYIDDIAKQLIHGPIGKRLKVVMGGGEFHLRGLRRDGRKLNTRPDLVAQFRDRNINNIVAYTSFEGDWEKVNVADNAQYMGLFAEQFLPYHLNYVEPVPSLENMTRRAIEILSVNRDGYFLLVNSALIFSGHVYNRAQVAIDETAELNKAVAKALEMTNESETLIVVTSTFGSTMSLAGYPPRSKNIFGNSEETAEDGQPYAWLSYANGPGFMDYYSSYPRATYDKSFHDPHRSPKSGDILDFESFPASVPFTFNASPGGEDVPVYANGPFAYLFSGVYDQSTIPHLIQYAARNFVRKDQFAYIIK